MGASANNLGLTIKEKKTNSGRKGRRKFLEELPRTEPRTMAGEMLRRYWHPVCLSRELKDIPVAVRMLGEDLVLFRDLNGHPGLIGAHCSHRGASLEYGQVREKGLMCSYHGWTYDTKGRCVDMPLEPPGTKLKEKIRHLWYPSVEWAGLIWTYMGLDKESPPPLPKIDVLARSDGEVHLVAGDFRNYNYLNWMENFADMGHAFILHSLEAMEVPDELKPYNDATIKSWIPSQLEFVETDYGMKTVAVWDAGDAGMKFVNAWSIALPTHWRFSGVNAGLPPDFTDERREGGGMLRIIDDTHFEIFRYTLLRNGNFRGNFIPRKMTAADRGLPQVLEGTVEKKDYDKRKYSAWEGIAPLEDLVLQESQGEIADRTAEHLATSDRGVILLRKILRQAMEDAVGGKQPKAVRSGEKEILDVDTFHGHIKASELEINSRNLPSSLNGEGLIRDSSGKLVFC
jgi:phthalate 4,5-dioxygenase oxygenase subunit